MASTIKTAKVNTALKQIATLQATRDQIAANHLTHGAKTMEMVDELTNQIVSLYEEIDALEGGGATLAAQTVGRDDEVTVTPAEADLLARTGWTVADLQRWKRKQARRLGR